MHTYKSLALVTALFIAGPTEAGPETATRAVILHKATGTNTNQDKTRPVFFPGEVVVVRRSTGTLALVVGEPSISDKGPAWIPRDNLATPETFEPIPAWNGQQFFTVCSGGSCDGGSTIAMKANGTFREDYEEGNWEGAESSVSTGRLFRNGSLVWARLHNGKAGFTNQLDYMHVFRLGSDGALCSIVHEPEAKDGCVCVPEEGPSLPCDEGAGKGGRPN